MFEGVIGRWVCPVCEKTQTLQEVGARCEDHPDAVLLHPEILEKFRDHIALGRVIGGKYAVFSILGIGGYGAVYRAVQEPVGRQVAVKVVRTEHSNDPELRARFFREAKVVASLKDPTVVTLYDYGEESDIGLYMVFELVEGFPPVRCCKIWTVTANLGRRSTLTTT